MAYEVARVHGIILSNIQDREKDVTDIWPPLKGIPQMSRTSPDSPFLQDFPTDLNQWSECSHSSLGSSTETESDDDNDFIAGLAEQIAHSMLDDDEPGSDTNARPPGVPPDQMHFSGLVNPTSQKIAGSPQLSWSPNDSSVSWSDSVSSSKRSSQVSSPPSTPSTSEGDAWELLNAAAGEVVRLKMTEESRPVPIGRQIKTSPGSVHSVAKQSTRLPMRPATYCASSSSASNVLPIPSPPISGGSSLRMGSSLTNVDRVGAPGNGHLQRTWTRPRFNQPKPANHSPVPHRLARNDGVCWSQRQSRPGNHNKGNVSHKSGRQNFVCGGQPRFPGRSIDGSGGPQRSGGHVLNGGSGMRAVFLGSAGSGRESGGTGVFLPRCVGSGNEQRRKPACSTVLLPSRIVQVLNLNVEDMRSHPTVPAFAGHSRSEFSGALRNPPHMYMMDLSAGATRYGSENIGQFARKVQAPHVRQIEPLELGLPTEWTY